MTDWMSAGKPTESSHQAILVALFALYKLLFLSLLLLLVQTGARYEIMLSLDSHPIDPRLSDELVPLTAH